MPVHWPHSRLVKLVSVEVGPGHSFFGQCASWELCRLSFSLGLSDVFLMVGLLLWA